MTKLNALDLAQKIQGRMVQYLLQENFTKDPKFQKIHKHILESHPNNGGIVTELIVEGAFPYQCSGQSLYDLVQTGKFNSSFCEHLEKDNKFDTKRKLYSHQEEAISIAEKGYREENKPSIVISSGTGSGKTESFLLPVLNDLNLRTPQAGEGISTLILYPMNALVNDQVKRISGLLDGQKDITVFEFTSQTLEDSEKTNNSDSHLILSRNDARQKIPSILITNYSMLEYMLCRPQDNCFFGRNLRTVVLDEAHLYSGTLATEISLLLRRLYDRCNLNASDVLQIATSATLVKNNEEGDNILKNFIGSLFSKEETSVCLVKGKQLKRLDTINLKQKLDYANFEMKFFDELEMASKYSDIELDACFNFLQPIFPTSKSYQEELIKKHNNELSSILYEVLHRSELFAAIETLLWEEDSKRINLKKLTQNIFNCCDDQSYMEARKVMIAFLCLGSLAREDSSALPLIPHKIHFAVGAPSDLMVYFDVDGYLEKKAPENKYLANYFIFSTNPYEDKEQSTYPLSLMRNHDNGDLYITGEELEIDGIKKLLSLIDNFNDGDSDNEPCTRRKYFVTEEPNQYRGKYFFNPRTGSLTFPEGQDGSILLYEIDLSDEKRRSLTHFNRGEQFQIQILAETMLSELPEMALEAKERGGINSEWLPARGRRLLAFSDSRSRAAYLGTKLTEQHELILFRACILEALEVPLSNERRKGYEEKLVFLQGQYNKATDEILKAEYEDEIKSLTQQINYADIGMPINDFVDRLKKPSITTRIKELFAQDYGEKHSTSKENQWGQNNWEKNTQEIQKEVFYRLAKELIKKAKWPIFTLENLGYAQICYPKLDQLTIPQSLEEFLSDENFKILSNNWTNILTIICDWLRECGSISLTKDENKQASRFTSSLYIDKWTSFRDDYRNSLNKLFSNEPRNQTKHEYRSRVNRFIDNILRSIGIGDDSQREVLIEKILLALFNQLTNSSFEWLEVKDRETKYGSATALKLIFDKLNIKKVKTVYRSKNTGEIVHTHVLNFTISGLNDVVEVSEDELDNDLRISQKRKELKEDIFKIGLWSEEHSAQISTEENNRTQELFKRGIRNILSCTTTMELGIDIGGLNAVLMTNVAPNKANYLQRSGRAGRRSDGSSVVVTFAGSGLFSKNIFSRFEEYLSSDLMKPKIFFNRPRIVLRHCNSFFLGEFFRDFKIKHSGAMGAYGNIGEFCGVPKVAYWLKDGRPKPKAELLSTNSSTDFISFLDRLSINYEKYDQRLTKIIQDTNNSVENLLQEIRSSFRNAFKAWIQDYNGLLEVWETTNDISHANALYYQLSLLYENHLIAELVKLQVLPAYGFPVELLRLHVHDEAKLRSKKKLSINHSKYKLERDSLRALADYVPGSVILAAGKQIYSQGLLKHWAGENIEHGLGLRGQFIKSSNGSFEYSIGGEPSFTDPDIKISQSGYLIFPKYGFTTALWKEPERVSSNSEHIGKMVALGLKMDLTNPKQKEFQGIEGLDMYYQEGGEILAINEGENRLGFDICLKCGYAESSIKADTEKYEPSPSFLEHPPIFNSKETSSCWKDNKIGKKPLLDRQIIAATHITDVIVINFSKFLNQTKQESKDTAIILTQALRITGAQILEVDPRNIGFLEYFLLPSENGFAIVLFDTLTGGAGHVCELLETYNWFEKTLELLTASLRTSASGDRENFRYLLLADNSRLLSSLDPLAVQNAENLLGSLLCGGSFTEKLHLNSVTSERSKKSKDERIRKVKSGKR
jgi:DEAD/DEAH box helicase domain-containing protein